MFCNNCGKELTEDDKFCPQCGAVVTYYEESNPSGEEMTNRYNTELIIVGAFCLIWALIAIFSFGWMLTADMAGMLKEPDVIQQIMDAGGYTYEEAVQLIDQSIGAIYAVVGVIVASGVLALIAAIFCFIRRFYILTLILIILSSILGLVLVLGVIGFVFAVLVYNWREGFKDYKPAHA